MTNNLSSNTTSKVMRVFMEEFENARVLTKTVNTQLLQGKITPQTGSSVSFKRPHDYAAIRTSGGDIGSSTKSSILAGKATSELQNYITVATEWTNLEEATQLDQLREILRPMATRAVTTLETSFADYMMKNVNLSVGTPGTAVDAWSDIGDAYALMHGTGIPMDKPWYYVMNPFTCRDLADVQNSLYGNDGLIASAWQKSAISSKVAGMDCRISNALSSYTSGTASDRAGTVNGNPTVTYVGAKDTMYQDIGVAAMTASATIKAGEIVEITGRYRLNQSTRTPIVDNGTQVKWRAVVMEDETLDSSGEGTLRVAGPAIYEANGQYNTTDAAVVNGDVITVLGSASTLYQPNLFYHPDAFGVGTVKLPKLYSTDTVATTEDGFSLRASRYSDGDANEQKIRFDLLPSFICFNPFLAGQGFGS